MTTELQQRIIYFSNLFEDLQSTNSRLEKEYYLSGMPENYKEDWMYILEVLDGRRPFGYKYYYSPSSNSKDFHTIKEVLEYLHIPIIRHDLSETYINFFVSRTSDCYYFLEPIVNRTLKLGIGRSLLPKTNKSPMLAKKLEDVTLPIDGSYFVTEKLDGNRCIAEYVEDHWEFTSRNGKPMRVDINMDGLDTDYVYDGELLSYSQTLNSIVRTEAIIDNHYDIKLSNDDSFNSTSGLINSKKENKELVYNIFDVIVDEPYYNRRAILEAQKDGMSSVKNDVRILPYLFSTNNYYELENYISENLEKVVNLRGEGLMINVGNATYQNKRTNSLIKVKKTYTMDMRVVGTEYGTGKYDGMVGALYCSIEQNGCSIQCKVGSGLSDDQRFEWAVNPGAIIGKIVEVSYFSLSQDKSVLGSKSYSLRFPRLKKVRDDKEETSID